MEALVLQAHFRELFSDEELKTARERLRAYGYDSFEIGDQKCKSSLDL